MKRTYLALAAGLVGLAGAAALALWPVQAPGLLRPDDTRLVRAGEAIYARACASCHGAQLQGEPDWQTPKANGRRPAPPHDVTGHTWHHTDRLLIDLTRRGTAAVIGGGYESDMPGFSGVLDDDEIIAVLSFIKSRWPDEIRRRHDELNSKAGQ